MHDNVDDKLVATSLRPLDDVLASHVVACLVHDVVAVE
jgi:hypothetical protein